MSHTHGDASPSPPPAAAPRKPDILRGWIKTAKDAMLVLEAARAGIVPRVTRRFHEAEKRSIIQSGAIFVFTEEESGIKRWTDPHLWTASRMQGCFLMYREREDTRPDTETPPYRCSAMAPLSEAADQKGDKELEHYILGSWNTGRGLKKNGLMKKTISISIEDTTYHLISYYYPSDVRSGLLQTPSSMPEFACLDISPAMKVSFSQTRTLHGGRGKRGRPSRSQSKKEAGERDSGESVPSTPRTAPITPVNLPSSRARAPYRHPSLTPSAVSSSSRPSSPRSRYHPYPKLNTPSSSSSSPNFMPPSMPDLQPYSESPASSSPATPRTYELTPSPCETKPPYPIWQHSPLVHPSPDPMPVTVYDIPYPPIASQPGLQLGSGSEAYYQSPGEAQDVEAQQQLIRSWEPIMEETRLMMSGHRPVPQILSYEAYYVDPSAYY